MDVTRIRLPPRVDRLFVRLPSLPPSTEQETRSLARSLGIEVDAGVRREEGERG